MTHRSPGAVALTVIEIIQERLLPYLNRPMSSWNSLQAPSAFGGLGNPLFLPYTPSEMEGFTAVILTYDRLETLFTLITR